MQTLIIQLGKYVFAKMTQVTTVSNFTFDITSAANIANANIEVYAFEAYSAAEVATDQLGNNLIPAADAPKLMFSLCNTQGNLLLENASFQRSRASQNSGFVTYLNNFKVDLTKSYITLTATGGGLVANQVAGFVFYYRFIK